MPHALISCTRCLAEPGADLDPVRACLAPDLGPPGLDVAHLIDRVDHRAARQQLAVVVAAVDMRDDAVDASPDANGIVHDLRRSLCAIAAPSPRSISFGARSSHRRPTHRRVPRRTNHASHESQHLPRRPRRLHACDLDQPRLRPDEAAGEQVGDCDAAALRRTPPRRFPIVNVTLIAANFVVWLLYELPHLNSAVYHASFYSCTVNGSCRGPAPWQISWFTAMFIHGSWSHIPRQHALPRHLRQERRRRVRTPPLPRLLHSRRFRRDDDANRSHPGLRLGVGRTRPESRRKRRDRRRPRRLLHPLPDHAHPDAGARLLRPDPAWVYLGGWFV
jgi:hypothetical protein